MLLERTLQRDFTNTQKRIHIKQRVYHYHGTSAGLVIGKLCFFAKKTETDLFHPTQTETVKYHTDAGEGHQGTCP